MIEPLNHDADTYLDMTLHFDEPEKVECQLDGVAENDTVTMCWRNATIVARAGTVKAWIEIDRMARS